MAAPERWELRLTEGGASLEGAGTSLGAAALDVLPALESAGLNRPWRCEAWIGDNAKRGMGLRLSEVVACALAERDARKRSAEEEQRKPLPRFERDDADPKRPGLVLVTRDGEGARVRRTVNMGATWRVQHGGTRVEVVTLENGGERWSVPALAAADGLALFTDRGLLDDAPEVVAPEDLEPLYRLLARAEWRD